MTASADAPNWIKREGLYTIRLLDDGHPFQIEFAADVAPEEMAEFTARFNREYSRTVLEAELSSYQGIVLEVEKLRRQVALEESAQRKALLVNLLEEKVKRMREVSPHM